MPPMKVRPAFLSVAWLPAVAGGALLPPLAILATGHTLVWRDTVKLFEPLRTLVGEATRNLRLPLWNPYEGLGVPLFAQMMHAVLHPVSILAAFALPRAGADLFILAYIALAATGAAFLARTLGASRTAASLAGLGYGLSGYVLGMSAVLTYLGAAATAPWTIAALCRAGRRVRWGLPVAALAVAVLWFAGDPQWAIVSLLAALALVLEEDGPHGLVPVGGAVALGTALAAIQLLPAAVFLNEATRSVGLSAAERAQWALSPWRIPEFFAPGLLAGRPGVTLGPPVFRWIDGSPERFLGLPFVPSVFVGAALLVFAGAGAFGSRRGRMLAAGSALTLWLAFGHHAGAEQALHAVPIWGAFRYSEKLVGPLTLWLALLATLGADRLAGKATGSRWPASLLGGAVVLGGISVAATRGWSLWPLSRMPPAVADVASSQFAIGFGSAALALLALAAVFENRRRRPTMGAMFPSICLVIVFLESAAAAPLALHAGTPGIVSTATFAGISVPDGPVRIAMPQPFGPYLAPPELDAADQATAAQSRLAFASFNVAARIDHLNTYTGIPPRRVSALYESVPLAAMRRYGLTHVVATEPRTAEQFAALREAVAGGVIAMRDEDWGFSVWEVPHRPWAAFAERALGADTEETALRAVRDSRGAVDAPAVVEGPFLPPTSAGRVLGFDRSAGRIRIVCSAERDGVLVVNDAWWPGWRATVDGRPVPVWRADYAVRAVPWPAGGRVLEMVYDPPEVRTGIVITLLATVLLAAFSFAFEHLRKRKPAPENRP
ncbi:MAG TPA: hypothetical protein VMK12_13170 [Anaeromyxobacteraceae bacterium]|nr:hypothetical protein [Anaeromyxobacteraceae bacterium]